MEPYRVYLFDRVYKPISHVFGVAMIIPANGEQGITVQGPYSDPWGDILDRPDDGCIEIRWFDTTGAMAGEDFNRFLETYAGYVETSGHLAGLVDATQFRMDFSKMSVGWRDENIIPRCNAARVRKFALVMSAGAPPMQKPPALEGPQTFQPDTSRAVPTLWRG